MLSPVFFNLCICLSLLQHEVIRSQYGVSDLNTNTAIAYRQLQNTVVNITLVCLSLADHALQERNMMFFSNYYLLFNQNLSFEGRR